MSVIEGSTTPFLAIFDCDGTLVDSQDVIVSTMKNVFLNSGRELPEDNEIRRVIGLPLVELIMRLNPGLTLD